ncbi:hypothetical protein [Marinirhabdus gelatinilytica]|uniref:Uncharacterized protein n=1 Tax=Marinirhabdus gelatinilytica TaxID=1703343 RepID=A0A370QAS0_9FLAO|nr:hypothetical protein [Marinirhabdus gelatinilytica]RDK85466.1 hypothetical protein C8D94_103293 [Marinirhabdus gelatinilytica]
MTLTLLLAWLIATSCMTGFSYLFSTILGENFKEPQLLTDLLGEIAGRKLSVWVGWVVHYLTGIMFLGMLIGLYSITGVEVSIVWGIVFGMVMGGIGILMWKVLYKVAQEDPPTNTRLFHLQLIIAHVFFGMAAIAIEKVCMPYLGSL